MTHEVTMSKDAVSSVTSQGMTVGKAMEASAEIGTSGFGVSGSAKASAAQSSEESSKSKGTKAYVRCPLSVDRNRPTGYLLRGSQCRMLLRL